MVLVQFIVITWPCYCNETYFRRILATSFKMPSILSQLWSKCSKIEILAGYFLYRDPHILFKISYINVCSKKLTTSNNPKTGIKMFPFPTFCYNIGSLPTLPFVLVHKKYTRLWSYLKITTLLNVKNILMPETIFSTIYFDLI